jgi:predicted dehydrogenase
MNNINNSNKYNIAIIGAGSIGSRHLQGVKQARISMNIYVVDISLDSIDIAKKRYSEIGDNEYFKQVTYLSSLSELPTELDIAIIATSSSCRCCIILELIQTRKIHNMLIEKFLFPSIEEYTIVEKEFNERKIKVWVNCPLRLLTAYKELKKELSPGEKIIFNVSGSDWGIGCNAIHYIDLFAFFTGETDIIFDEMSGLYSKIYESKRNGYVEFAGVITGKTNNGSIITLTSSLSSSIPVLITIQSKNKTIVIKEDQDRMLIISEFSIEEKKIGMKFQSQLTGNIIEQIFNNSCELTCFHESKKLHCLFLEPLLSFYNSKLKLNSKKCPIT